MTPKQIRHLTELAADTDFSGIGIEGFWEWVRVNDAMPVLLPEDKRGNVLLEDIPDEHLQQAWARFMLEASEEEQEAVLLEPELEHEFDKGCGCEKCLDYARGEAEYYYEMRQDR